MLNENAPLADLTDAEVGDVLHLRCGGTVTISEIDNDYEVVCGMWRWYNSGSKIGGYERPDWFDCIRLETRVRRPERRRIMVSTSLGDKIRQLRKEKDLTLEQLAEKTDSSKGYIWELENRETKKPSAEKLQKIAEVLGVTTVFLLDEGKASPDDEVMKQALFRKLDKMGEDDRKKIMKIIDSWGDDT